MSLPRDLLLRLEIFSADNENRQTIVRTLLQAYARGISSRWLSKLDAAQAIARHGMTRRRYRPNQSVWQAQKMRPIIIANRSGQAPRSDNAPWLTKRIAISSNHQTDGFVGLHRTNGWRQPYDDAKAKGLVNTAQSKSRAHARGPKLWRPSEHVRMETRRW